MKSLRTMSGRGAGISNGRRCCYTGPELGDITTAVTDSLEGFTGEIAPLMAAVIGIAVFPLFARFAWRFVKSFVR